MNIRELLRGLVRPSPSTPAGPAHATGPDSLAPAPSNPASERTRTGGSEGNVPAPPALLKLPEQFRIKPEEPTRVRRLIVVGVDFGTSGTKVVFRNQLEKRTPPHVMDFGTTLPGFSRFSFPSTVAMVGDELLAGVDAEMATGGVTLRSAKMLLLNADRRDHARFRSELARHGADGTADMTYDFVVSVFLSEVLRLVHSALLKVYPGLDLNQDVHYNIDVPVDHLQPPKVQARFREALEIAIRLAPRRLCPGPVAGALREWLGARGAIQASRIPESERRTQVIPEAAAIMEGIRDLIPPDWGRNYAIVDIGAGTTDIGIFRVGHYGDDERIPFYAAETRAIGGDDLDGHIAEILVGGGASDNQFTSAVREAKSRVTSGKAAEFSHQGADYHLDTKHLAVAAGKVAPDCDKHYGDTFGQAYTKDKHVDHWRELYAIVVGGGSLIPPMRRLFTEAVPKRGFCKVHQVSLTELAGKTAVVAVGASRRPPAGKDLPFLVAALGLSKPLATMRSFIDPARVPVDRVVKSSTGLYSYELSDT